MGKIVELAPVDQLFQSPAHPYTEALLSAVALPESQTKEEARFAVWRGGGSRGYAFGMRVSSAFALMLRIGVRRKFPNCARSRQGMRCAVI